MNPLISIAVPARNSERTITETLQSIQRQTFADFEVLIADDGSTDRTSELVRSFREPRFRLICDGRTLGIAGRLNQLARLAKGHYLARMDADDIMHPDRLAKQLAAFDADSSIDVLGTDAYYIDEDGYVLDYFRTSTPSRDPWQVVMHGAFIHPTVMAPLSWFHRHPYSTVAHRAEDLELWMRTCRHSKFEVLREPLLYYRLRSTLRIRPIWESAHMTDKLILRCGAETNRLWEARRRVFLRNLRFSTFIVATLCGIRAARWRLRAALRNAHGTNFKIDARAL